MIKVIGLGPGHEDYILPISIKKTQSADMVIGAKRNIESVNEYCKKTMDLSVGFDTVGEYLKAHYDDDIAVIVSGDTGFYSMLQFVKRHVKEAYIEVIPGISSLQYMFAKLKIGYENSKWISCHGRDGDYVEALESYDYVGILTDRNNNVNTIADRLKQLQAYKNIKIYIGERLSYDDEVIKALSVEEALSYTSHVLSVVVLEKNRV